MSDDAPKRAWVRGNGQAKRATVPYELRVCRFCEDDFRSKKARERHEVATHPDRVLPSEIVTHKPHVSRVDLLLAINSRTTTVVRGPTVAQVAEHFSLDARGVKARLAAMRDDGLVTSDRSRGYLLTIDGIDAAFNSTKGKK